MSISDAGQRPMHCTDDKNGKLLDTSTASVVFMDAAACSFAKRSKILHARKQQKGKGSPRCGTGPYHTLSRRRRACQHEGRDVRRQPGRRDKPLLQLCPSLVRSCRGWVASHSLSWLHCLWPKLLTTTDLFAQLSPSEPVSQPIIEPASASRSMPAFSVWVSVPKPNFSIKDEVSGVNMDSETRFCYKLISFFNKFASQHLSLSLFQKQVQDLKVQELP